MADFLDKLREKPTHTRKIIAFSIAAGIVLVVFGFWIANIGSVFTAEDSTVDTVSGASPLNALGNDLAKIMGSIRDGVDGIRQEFSDSVNNASSTPDVATSTPEDQNPLENEAQNDTLDSYGGEGN